MLTHPPPPPPVSLKVAEGVNNSPSTSSSVFLPLLPSLIILLSSPFFHIYTPSPPSHQLQRRWTILSLSAGSMPALQMSWPSWLGREESELDQLPISRGELLSTYLRYNRGTSQEVASFPGPAQLSVACVLQATESWAGPGNEASQEAWVTVNEITMAT